MFMGEFHHNIDDKARIVMPSKFRFELGENFIVTRGLDECLFIYSNKEWNNLVDKLKTLSFTKKDVRAFMRFFLSGAVECSFDKQGRITLPSTLVSYANLEKECVIIGVNDRLEVWNEKTFNKYIELKQDEISNLAENLFDNMEV
mgnify:CR=1 FL=1